MIFCHLPDLVESVYNGLALEDLLTQRPEGSEPVLLIWTGPEAVVMGKNQNPWREVNLEALRKHNLPLARRISGGGTVYHDPGNVNISWVFPREEYDASRIQQVWTHTLKELGLIPQPGVSGGFRVQGKKVSGAAFCYRKDHVLHHGTLLLSAHLNRMRQLLSPRKVTVDTHAVDSIPAAVANLQDFVPEISADQVIEILRKHTEKEFGSLTPNPKLFDPQQIQTKADEFQQPEWIWDQTPSFKVEAGPLHFQVRKGMTSDWKQDGRSLDIPPLPFRKSSLTKWAKGLGMDAKELENDLADHGWGLPN